MRRNLFICAISALLTLTIILPGMSLYTAATEANTNDEEKVLCEATIEDDFSDDEILIVFKQKESLSFKDYSLDDFSDVDCKSVRLLFPKSDRIIKN